ncbi:MAG: HAD family phosphatase [bacterium]|nr:HAD family phosphatase [bacterium]
MGDLSYNSAIVLPSIFDNYPYPIMLVLSDLDGCLTGDEAAPVDCVQIKAIRRFNELALDDAAVPPVSICTGRPHAYVEAFGRFIAARLPSVFENGCGLHSREWGMGREYRYHPAITEDPEFSAIYRETVEYLRDNVIIPLDCGVIQGKRYCISITPRADRTMKELMEYIEAIPAHLRGHLNITRSIAVADVTPRGIDKGAGLVWLIEVLRDEFDMDIAFENVLAIGDSWGDLPMLNKVGIACAPANAADVAKEAADFVSESGDAEAVAEVIAGAVAINRRLEATLR